MSEWAEIVSTLLKTEYGATLILEAAQERAVLRPEGLPGGEILIESDQGSTNGTPRVEFTPDLVKMLANVASSVKTELYLVR